MENKYIAVMQGVSGAGKSTAIRRLRKIITGSEDVEKKEFEIDVCSADHHFINSKGQYVFDHTELTIAHAKCFYKFVELVKMEYSPIFIDNTNTQMWEVHPYMLMAAAFDYDAELVLVEPPSLLEASKRNLHNVSLENIQKQNRSIEQFQNFLRWRRVRYSVNDRDEVALTKL